MRPFKLISSAPLRLTFLLLMLVTALVLHAQGAENEGDYEDEYKDEYEGGLNIESDWSRALNLYNKGDQVFCINLGFSIPLFYVEQRDGPLRTNMKLGGFGSLAYNYFFDAHWFIGGEVSGMFAGTVGKKMYYAVPMGVRGGYQFILDRFEFPLSVLLGVAPQSHNERSYFGIFAKLGGGAFFRLNSEWSFGLNANFWWVPEWTKILHEGSSKRINIHGFFLETSLGARYHF